MGRAVVRTARFAEGTPRILGDRDLAVLGDRVEFADHQLKQSFARRAILRESTERDECERDHPDENPPRMSDWLSGDDGLPKRPGNRFAMLARTFPTD